MTRNFIRYSLIALAIAVATLVSSFLGAYMWAQTYPQIIEYTGIPHLENPQGKIVTEVHRGDWVVFNADVRRQPHRCWGEFIYVMHGERANFQMPMIRSYGLLKQAASYHVQNLMQVPAGMPAGVYTWDVVVYPYCDGIQLPPATYNLHLTTVVR